MQKTAHSIGKVTFHLKGAQTENIFAQRQEVASYMQNSFPVLLEQVLDDVAGNDELLYIPQLKIELKEPFTLIDAKKLDAVIKEELQTQLQLFKKASLGTKKGNSGEWEWNESMVNYNEMPGDALMLTVWSFFLQNGSLPSYISSVIWKNRINWFQKLKEKNTDALKLYFIKEIANKDKLKRFVLNETTIIQKFVLQTLNPQFLELFEKRFYYKPVALRNEKVVEDIYSLLIDLAKEYPENETPFNELKHMKEKETFNIMLQHRVTEKVPIFAANAGLVLLQPFIPQLFSELKIIDDERQRLLQKEKACALLSFLSGDDQQDETKYTLYKLLCGLSVHELVFTGVVLSVEEKNECTHLLQQVIKHWTALKETSTASLQHTFFNRTGKLTSNGDKWLLQVEQKTEDVLLQYLPWSYSIIRYPWMPQPLYTEWV